MNPYIFRDALPKFYDGTVDGFWLFCRAYLPSLFDNFPRGTQIIEPQRDMIAHLLDNKSEYVAERKTATMWYRGGGKTTTSDAVSIFLIIGKWYNDRREEDARLKGERFVREDPVNFVLETRYTVIYSFTEDAASRRIQTIQDCFSNKQKYPYLVNDFGHLLINKPKEKITNIYQKDEFVDRTKIKRSETTLVFSHGVRVEAMGMGQAIQGGNIGGVRPDFLRFDDPENPRSRDNKVDLFKRNIDFITNDCYNALDKIRGRIHVIGTNIAPGCTIDVLTQKQSSWRKNVFPHVTTPVPVTEEMMYSDEQVATDPQRFPLKLVRIEYENAKTMDEGLRGFYRDMYNIAYDPNSLDTSRIIRYQKGYFTLSKQDGYPVLKCKDWEKPKRVYLSIGVDPGGAKVGNNKTAMTPTALTEDEELILFPPLLLNKKAMTIDNDGYFNDLYKLIDEYGIKRVIVEAFGGGFKTVYDDLCVCFQQLDKVTGKRNYSKLIPFEDSTKSKKERAFPVLKRFIERDRFFCPEEDTDLLIRQIQTLAAGGGGEDDFVDSVVLSQHEAETPTPYREPIAYTAQRNYGERTQRERMVEKIYKKR